VQYGGQLPKFWGMTEVAGSFKMLVPIHQTVHYTAYQESIVTAMKNSNQKSRNFFISSPPEYKCRISYFVVFYIKIRMTDKVQMHSLMSYEV
jgi:hypothetical protein